MLRSLILSTLLASLITNVVAAPASVIAPTPPTLPTCGLTCHTSSWASGGCKNIADVECACTSQTYKKCFTECLQRTCTTDDAISQTNAYGEATCKQYGPVTPCPPKGDEPHPEPPKEQPKQPEPPKVSPCPKPSPTPTQPKQPEHQPEVPKQTPQPPTMQPNSTMPEPTPDNQPNKTIPCPTGKGNTTDGGSGRPPAQPPIANNTGSPTTPTTPGGSPPPPPACGLFCAGVALNGTSCGSAANLTCVCTNEIYRTNLGGCLQSNCTTAEANATMVFGQAQCMTLNPNHTTMTNTTTNTATNTTTTNTTTNGTNATPSSPPVVSPPVQNTTLPSGAIASKSQIGGLATIFGTVLLGAIVLL